MLQEEPDSRHVSAHCCPPQRRGARFGVRRSVRAECEQHLNGGSVAVGGGTMHRVETMHVFCLQVGAALHEFDKSSSVSVERRVMQRRVTQAVHGVHMRPELHQGRHTACQATTRCHVQRRITCSACIRRLVDARALRHQLVQQRVVAFYHSLDQLVVQVMTTCSQPTHNRAG